MLTYNLNSNNNNNRRESIIGGRPNKKNKSAAHQHRGGFYSDFDSDDMDEVPIITLGSQQQQFNNNPSSSSSSSSCILNKKKNEAKHKAHCRTSSSSCSISNSNRKKHNAPICVDLDDDNSTGCGPTCRRYGFRIMNLIFVLFVFQTFFGILASFVLLFSSGSEIYESTSGYERWQVSYKLKMGVVKIQSSARTLVDLMFNTLYLGKLLDMNGELEWMRLLKASDKMIISRQISSVQFIRYDDYTLSYGNYVFQSDLPLNTSSSSGNGNGNSTSTTGGGGGPSHNHFAYEMKDRNALLLSYDDLNLIGRYRHNTTFTTDKDWYKEASRSKTACWTNAYLNDESLYSIYFSYPVYSMIPTKNISRFENVRAIQPKVLELLNKTMEDHLFGIIALEFKIQNVNTFLNHSSLMSLHSAFIINDNGSVLARSSTDPTIDEIGHEVFQRKLKINTNDSDTFHYKGKVVEISTVRDMYNLTWTVVTTSFEKSYFSEVISTGIISVILFMVLFVIETLIVLCIVQSINQPLIDITKQMNNLISFKGLETPYKKHITVFNEIREMDDTIQITQRGIFAFSKYVPHIVAKMIVSNVHEYGRIGLELEPSMTVMYCGVNNFAALAEKTETTVFIRVITEYYSSISQVIEAHYGIIEKFIEGTVMVFWNEKSFRCKNHESRACKAAIECMEVVQDLNSKWNKLMGIQLNVSIGIHSGEMLVGALGNKSRMSFTVIGDACNVALRLQTLAQNYSTILVGGEIMEKVKEEFVFYFVDLIKLRGKSNPTCVYNLVAFRKEASDFEFKLEKDLLQAKELLFSGQYSQFYGVCVRLADIWSDSLIVTKLFERAKKLQSHHNEEVTSDSEKSDNLLY